MKKMQLIGLYNIRRKKRVSRKKLAEDLDLSVEYIKALETTNEEMVGDTLIQMFADYFKCSPYQILNDDEGEHLIDKKISIEKIEIPEGVNMSEANNLFFELLKKYSPIDSDNIDTLIAEFKYRLEDLSDEDPVSRLIRSEFEIDDEDEDEDFENIYGEPLELIPEVIQKIRKDAATAAIFYKELRAQGLSPTEALMIIRTIMG